MVFCCVSSVYTYLTKLLRCSVWDLIPPFVQGAVVYVHIQYDTFVALDILEVSYMGILSAFRLFRECFHIAERTGLIACCKYLFGARRLPDLDAKSSVFPESGIRSFLSCFLLIVYYASTPFRDILTNFDKNMKFSDCQVSFYVLF